MKQLNFLNRYIFGYARNANTGEVHRLKRLHKNCNRELWGKRMKYCTRLWAWYLMKYSGYNGCKWCYKSKDTG